MYGIIYLLTSPSGKHYVGQTVRTLEHRWGQHVTDKTKRPIRNAILKYGPDSFDKDIIAECPDKQELDRLERYWIQLLNTTNPLYGYNLENGGHGKKLANETKEKISEALKEFYKNKPHHRLGIHHTEETKRKMSAIAKSRPAISEEHLEKLNASHTGKPRSEEVKRKISGSMTGSKHYFYGKHHSEETKQKISEATKGRVSWNKGLRRTSNG